MLAKNDTFSSFSVDDLQSAKQFYGAILGLEVDETPMGLDVRHGNGARTFIYEKPDHRPASFTVLNFIVDDVARAADTLAAAGVAFEHYDQDELKTDERGIHSGGGVTIAWFKDPAGNILSVVEAD